MQPEARHFARDVLAHVREIPVLRSDQVRSIARGDVRLTQVLAVIADACHDGRRILDLTPQRGSVDQGERERQQEGGMTHGAHSSERSGSYTVVSDNIPPQPHSQQSAQKQEQQRQKPEGRIGPEGPSPKLAPTFREVAGWPSELERAGACGAMPHHLDVAVDAVEPEGDGEREENG
jgi:hypothetical protein